MAVGSSWPETHHLRPDPPFFWRGRHDGLPISTIRERVAAVGRGGRGRITPATTGGCMDRRAVGRRSGAPSRHATGMGRSDRSSRPDCGMGPPVRSFVARWMRHGPRNSFRHARTARKPSRDRNATTRFLRPLESFGKIEGFTVSNWTCPGCRCGKLAKLARRREGDATETTWFCPRCWTEWRSIQRPDEPPAIVQGLALVALQAAENGGSG